MRAIKKAGALAYLKVLLLGGRMDGKIDKDEIKIAGNAMNILLEDINYQVRDTKEYIKDKKKYRDSITDMMADDKELEDCMLKIKVNSDLDSITTELDAIFNRIIKDLDIADNKKKKFIKVYLLRELALLIGIDFEFSKIEVEYFHFVRKKLDIRKDKADDILRAEFLNNKRLMLDSFEIIPTVSKKIINYIDSEFDDLQSVAKMDVEKFREHIPGLSKPSALAIQRKVNAFSKISEAN